MLRLDKRTVAEAEDVLRWSQADAFWQSNILSMPTFREKYDRLRLQMKRGRRGSTGVVDLSDLRARYAAGEEG